jgi:molybdenum cofactor synthesis domain-containing protein
MEIKPQPKAAMLVIGDEILSGKTRDANVQHLATKLMEKGIKLTEVRMVTDEKAAIIKAVNELRQEYKYVFTSGGIGPTHDDITAESIAEAFGKKLIFDDATLAKLAAYYAANGREFNDARKSMARMPEDARAIVNDATIAPGFAIENVYVMAGIPRNMQAMLEAVLPELEGGTPTQSVSLKTTLPEGTFSAGLTAIQKEHPTTAIGSYPKEKNGKPDSVTITISSQDTQEISTVRAKIEALLRQLGGSSIEEKPAGISDARAI